MTEATATTGLNRIARPDGPSAIVAIEQRTTLRRMYKAAGRVPEKADMMDLKADIAPALNPNASVMLVNPDIGAHAVACDGVLDPGLLRPGRSRASGQKLVGRFMFLSDEGQRLGQCVESIDVRARPWAVVWTSR